MFIAESLLIPHTFPEPTNSPVAFYSAVQFGLTVHEPCLSGVRTNMSGILKTESKTIKQT